MNPSISVLFRAIPLAMGAVCLAFGLYILSRGADANHFVAGHVNVALTAICIALFATAATIIRQLVHRYGKGWEVVLPAARVRGRAGHDGLGHHDHRARR